MCLTWGGFLVIGGCDIRFITVLRGAVARDDCYAERSKYGNKSQGNTTVRRFLKSIRVHEQSKDEKNVFYKNTNVMIRLSGRNTDFFKMIAGFMQRVSLAPYFFIVCLNYVL